MKNNLLKNPSSQKYFLMTMIALIGVQCLFGMFINLFVRFPQDVLGWITVHRTISASFHLYLGAALTLVSIFNLYAAAIKKEKRQIASAILVFAGLVTAGINGAIFVDSQNDVNSFFMAFGFVVSTVSYAYGLFGMAR